MEAPVRDLVYLYCITKSKPHYADFPKTGIEIYPIYSQGIYAIVSKVSSSKFSEDNLKKKLTDMNWVERNVRQHENVVEAIMQKTAVLPFKFASVFQTEKNVEKLLKEHSEEFKKIIANLEGTGEWGLKMYCNPEKLKALLEEENETIREKAQEIALAGKGKEYFLKRKRDELIKNMLNGKISEYTQDSFEKLKKMSRRARINKILPKEVTEKKEDMILNSVFLVNKKRIAGFSNVLANLKTKYSDKGLSFDCSGPWPPYNFCSICNNGGKHG